MDNLPTLGTLLYAEKKKKRSPRDRRIRQIIAAVTGSALALLLAFFLFVRSMPPADVDGVWRGTIIQESGGLTSVYHITLTIEQQDGQISGTSHVWIPEDPSDYAVMTFSGNVQYDAVRYSDMAILEHHLEPDWYWCMKAVNLYLHDGKLTGSWSAPNCSSGPMELTQDAAEG